MIFSLYKKHMQSIKSKLIFNVVMAHAILMSFIVYDLIHREHNFLKGQFYEKGYELTSLLASNVSVPLLNNDLVGLDELISDLDKVKGHYLVLIMDKYGRVRAATDQSYINKSLEDDTSKQMTDYLLDNNIKKYQYEHDNLLDTIEVVKVDEKVVGYVRILLNEDFLLEEMNIVTRKGFFYVLMAIVLGAMFAWAIVGKLTLRLNTMVEAAEKISRQDFDVELPLSKDNDELSKMMHAFNVMSQSIDGYIGELKASTIKLQESEARLLEAQEIGHIGSWELDLETQMMHWSPEVYKIHAKDPQTYDTSLENYMLNLNEEDQHAVQTALHHAIETGEKTELECQINLDNNEVKHVHITGIADYDESGKAYKIRGVTQDITQHTIDMQKLKVKEKQLLIQSRLAQMGELISMIAHQWRQPLSAIAATAMDLKVKIELEAFDMSTEEGREESKVVYLKNIDDIETYVQSLSSTINDFRNFYKADKDRVHISLDEVVEKALGIIKSALQSDKIDLVYKSNAIEKIALFDGEIMQVILNIIKNSQDNFREKETKSPRIDIVTTDRSIEICDNGGGISSSIMGNIYDPYFSSKAEKNGTGLGLYMSKIIIEDHHKGILKAENMNDGVCFKILL